MTRKVTILDGGMGRELERMGAPFSQPLWSAQALIESPRSVFKAHLNFIAAGADYITTNAYALVPHHMGEELYKERHEELIRNAAELAGNAADQSFRYIYVGGCIPPVFGSYRPDLFNEEKAHALLAPFFTLQRAYCDFWLAETISSMQEARAIKKAYDTYGNERQLLWMAFTMDELCEDPDNPCLRSGEPLREVIADIIAEFNPGVLLFNCCPVESILPAIKIAKAAMPVDSKMGLGAYANAFTNSPEPRRATITSTLRQDVTPAFYLEYAKEWAEAGATIIGGCCGVGPEHIRAIKEHFDAPPTAMDEAPTKIF